MNLKELTIVEARAHMVKGTFSATEYVTELLRSEPDAVSLNAFVARDTGQMLKEAVAADASGASRNAAKLLAGIPIALKDNINTTGLPTTGCTGALKGKTPTENAPVARQLFDAGAILAGKNNMHELAFGISTNNAVTGAARNPWQTDLIPGGSSGGSAAAVGGRLVPTAIGTDTGASVRLPAALCGVTGFRPSMDRYSQRGILPISHTRDTPGPIARSVADIQLLDQLLSGKAQTSAAVDLRGLRIGLPRTYFFTGLDSAGNELEKFHYLFNPGVKFEEKITQITGITPEMLKNEKSFSVIAQHILELIEVHDEVVAHNLSFDMAMIDIEMKRCGKKVKWPSLLSSMAQSVFLWPCMK